MVCPTSVISVKIYEFFRRDTLQITCEQLLLPLRHTQHKERPYSELFCSSFSRIWTECGEIRSELITDDNWCSLCTAIGLCVFVTGEPDDFYLARLSSVLRKVIASKCSSKEDIDMGKSILFWALLEIFLYVRQRPERSVPQDISCWIKVRYQTPPESTKTTNNKDRAAFTIV